MPKLDRSEIERLVELDRKVTAARRASEVDFEDHGLEEAKEQFADALDRWFRANLPALRELEQDARRYHRIRLKAWLDSCVDDLVVGTRQAKESEFNAGHDAMIDAEYPDADPKLRGGES